MTMTRGSLAQAMAPGIRYWVNHYLTSQSAWFIDGDLHISPDMADFLFSQRKQQELEELAFIQEIAPILSKELGISEKECIALIKEVGFYV